jgi:hypothetical protein
MGAFYGSVQVRSTDLDRVKAVAEEVARRLEIRMLVGPALGGWVGVYPEGSGQDPRVSGEMAKELAGDVLHFLVHDEDIFAYWLYYDGGLVDSFHSSPGYFGDANRAEEQRMAGDAEAFRPLLQNRTEEMRPLLGREGRPFGFESNRLEQFANLLGITNALTSYEYLKEDDHEGIKGWRKFVEVPADKVANAREQKRLAKESLKNEVNRLKAEGLLLDRKVSRDETPSACGLADGLFVVWSYHRKETVSFSRYTGTGKKPEAIPLDNVKFAWAAVSDAAGRQVAMAARDCVQVWDIDSTSWTHVCDFPTVGASGLALSADGSLVAYSSGTWFTVMDVASGRRILEIADRKSIATAFHPSGKWLAVGRPVPGLVAIDEEPHWRFLFQRPAKWSLATAAKHLKMDVRALIELTRQFNQKLTPLGREFQHQFEDRAVVDARIEKHNQEQEAKLAQLQADWEAVQRGDPPRPEPVQESFAVGFSRDGRWFWRGTFYGLFVYEWSKIPRDLMAELPEPTWRFEPPKVAKQMPLIVYAAAEEPDSEAIVFGGTTGWLYRLDLTTGDVRELIKLPGECHIQSLALSRDGNTLGLTAQVYPLESGPGWIEEGTIWEVWNYARLRESVRG